MDVAIAAKFPRLARANAARSEGDSLTVIAVDDSGCSGECRHAIEKIKKMLRRRSPQ